jgi:hypothetical protein
MEMKTLYEPSTSGVGHRTMKALPKLHENLQA